ESRVLHEVRSPALRAPRHRPERASARQAHLSRPVGRRRGGDRHQCRRRCPGRRARGLPDVARTVGGGDGRGLRGAAPRTGRHDAGVALGPPHGHRPGQEGGAVAWPGPRDHAHREPRRRRPPADRPGPARRARLRRLAVLLPRRALRQREQLAHRRRQPHLLGVRHPAGAHRHPRPARRLPDVRGVADPLGAGLHRRPLRHPVQRVGLQAGQRLVL
ncbi:MAG: hypothetical protein AVDCRST_MAG06-715, partial [uncultured Nocardioides sp.]